METKISDVAIPKFDLTGKVAVITGGTKGLGYATAVTFANYGANVAVCSRTPSDCERVERELKLLGVDTLGVKADVTHIDEIQNLIDKVVEKFGRVDIMVNNAGNADTVRAVEMTEEQWDYLVNLDLKAVFFCAQAAAKQMIAQGTGGKIINIASLAGTVGSKGIGHYCSAKAGVVNLTRTLALEWAKFGILVNAICPGYFYTSLNEDWFKNPKFLQSVKDFTAVKRLATFDEITAPILLLASDHSGYMTGSHIVIDGGASAQ